jgi:hypothetical protein
MNIYIKYLKKTILLFVLIIFQFYFIFLIDLNERSGLTAVTVIGGLV